MYNRAYRNAQYEQYRSGWSLAILGIMIAVGIVVLLRVTCLCNALRIARIHRHLEVERGLAAGTLSGRDIYGGFYVLSANLTRVDRLAGDSVRPPPANPLRSPEALKDLLAKTELEYFCSRADMETWPVGKLQADLRKLRARYPAAFSARDLADPDAVPEGKDELVEELFSARGGSSGTTCSFCLEDYKAADTVRVLPCGHRFRAKCIDPWLQKAANGKCPICQTEIATHGEQGGGAGGAADACAPGEEGGAGGSPSRLVGG